MGPKGMKACGLANTVSATSQSRIGSIRENIREIELSQNETNTWRMRESFR